MSVPVLSEQITVVEPSVSTDARRLTMALCSACLLYTSDAADERSSVDLGGRRIIKKKKSTKKSDERTLTKTK